ncbi:hypothetical protein METBIDRAFT_118075 [Metschnikowia bicuspidata var. bicuspidata NRRL YB-4993]|uniref:CBM21 domain-containing protein n=1 Tax=Metschnikowia bicuspidata var. bicuspidata NRRL YB-4993 TaxID=869754 RepID=A0A1A0HJD6_9ASCO|nr:hypothetical protein METBIDRAFT_118075 [Metschnikowia bicuspidata var. bicuspidata NRRL YB-4993]OBA24111.1 hypothetical protein METBIDRAFT_118075 [Metschnikowia bicuspidata var. bicuspidata NRRL YB-4993]
MSTLTLSVESFFKPELASSVPSLTAGSASKKPAPAAKKTRLAPELVARDPTSLPGGFLAPVPAISVQEPGAQPGACLHESRAHDDSGAAVLWTGAGAGIAADSGMAPKDTVLEHVPPLLQRHSAPKFVDIPLVIQALPALPSAPVAAAKTAGLTMNRPAASGKENPFVSQHGFSMDASAPALRKLKLSLKLPKLTKLQSMSQLSPKSVRFASRLEKVKMFDGMASPSTVSLQCTPAGSPKYGFLHEDYFSVHNHFNDISDDETYSSSDSDTYAEFTLDRQYKIAKSNFTAPPNIYARRGSAVYLQSVSLAADKQLLELLVMCQNLAFEKNLLVKLTFNDWQSLMIYTSAAYCKLFSSVNYDQFKFTIPLKHLPSPLSAQFCIKYVVNNSTFWDNNDTNNYRLSLEKCARPAVAKEMFSFKPSAVKDSFTYKPPTFSPKSSVVLGSAIFATQANDEAPANVPKSGPGVSHYNELVNKLMSVKDSNDTPKYTRSLALSPRPRYSQSYMAKRGSDTNIPTLLLGKKPSSEPLALEGPSTGKTVAALVDKRLEERTDGPAGGSRPALLRSHGSVPATLSSTNIGAMSYADLLQNYCFNGANAKAPGANHMGSFNSSCNSSSNSLSSDYTTLASTLHSVNDSFFV